MSSISIEYHLFEGIGWLFALDVAQPRGGIRSDADDIALQITGYRHWRLPFEFVAQMAWCLMKEQSPPTVTLPNEHDDIRGFSASRESGEIGSTFKRGADRTTFYPAGLCDLRELLRYETMPAMIRFPEGFSIKFTQSYRGWSVDTASPRILEAASDTAARLGVPLQPFDIFAPLIPADGDLNAFDT